MVLQSVLVPTKLSLKNAIKWIKKKGYKEYFIGKDGIKKGAHISRGYYRFRQSEPLTEKQKKNGWFYATDKLRNGVLLIYTYYI